jgi:hypothetical protein
VGQGEDVPLVEGDVATDDLRAPASVAEKRERDGRLPRSRITDEAENFPLAKLE